MASDMSGFQGADGKERWKQASGGDDAAYNREMAAWQNSQGGAAQQTAATANTGGQAQPGGGTTQYTGPADTTQWQTNVAMTDDAHPDANKPSGDPFVDMVRNASHGSEDYARFSNAQILAWKDKYVPGSNPPKFKNDFGDVVDKPTESGPLSQAAGFSTGERDAGQAGGGGQGGGGGRGGSAYAPPPPPPPTTFGNQLSMTGNPLQDMLIGQFNTGMDPTTNQANIFALGEDMRVGGAGRNLDQGTTAPVRQGQSLGGGGLWWGQDKETFGGFDASQKNAEGPATTSPAAPAAAPAAPAAPASPAAAPAQTNGPSRIGGMYVAPRPQKPTAMAGMVQNQFSSPARNRASYF